MNTLIKSAVASLFLIGVACSGSPEDSSGNARNHTSGESGITTEKTADGKWILDPGVAREINEIQEHIAEFKHKSNPHPAEYKHLGNLINGQVEDIFRDCTMPSGEAHDDLHEYVSLIIVYVKSLRADGDFDRVEVLQDMEDHLDAFSQNFQ